MKLFLASKHFSYQALPILWEAVFGFLAFRALGKSKAFVTFLPGKAEDVYVLGNKVFCGAPSLLLHTLSSRSWSAHLSTCLQFYCGSQFGSPAEMEEISSLTIRAVQPNH